MSSSRLELAAGKPIAVTDLETTGLAAGYHEIIEVGLCLLSPSDLRTVAELSVKVKPLHPRRLDWVAAQINGYRAADWREALDLETAMERYAELTQGAVFAAHNARFDWSFLNQAFATTGIGHGLERRYLDTMWLAWDKFSPHGLARRSLQEVARFLGLPPEPKIHRAINGARLAAEILRRVADGAIKAQLPLPARTASHR